MKISIVGLGWFGGALAQELSPSHEVSGTTRSQAKVEEFSRMNVNASLLNPPDLPALEVMDADVMVLNIPPFEAQLSWFKSWSWNPRTHLIFISSTSVYGQKEGVLTESETPLPETENGRLLVASEDWVRTFHQHTVIRFGGLIGGGRHPGKVLSGRKGLSGGGQPVNLTHLEDAKAFVKLLIAKKSENETFNFVSPEHPSREEYYGNYCRAHQLPLPEFVQSESSGKIISSEKCLKIHQFRTSLRNF